MADIFELHAPLKHKARDVSYDNTSSGLSALNVKTAIDELAAEHTGSGENNTASNIGVGGIGLFKQKVGVNLEFKNINSGSSKITVTNDAVNNELDLDVNEANVIHDNLSGAGAQTHAQIDTHIGDATLHFTEESISHLNISDIGTNSHATIDTHIASSTNPHSVSLEQARTQSNVLSGDIAMSGATVTGLGTPVAGTDATTKDYVDGLIQGLDWQDSVLDKDLSTPPGSPVTGDRYIVKATGTGDWTGKDNQITEWNGSAWTFTVTSEGLAAWIEDEDKLYVFNGTAWVTFGSTQTHNNLGGLQGGTATEYFHLTSAEHTEHTTFFSASDITGAEAETLTDGSNADALHTHSSGTDADAIHDNVSAEISAIAEKTSPVGADLILIEDSAASNVKKRLQISNLPAGAVPGFTGIVSKSIDPVSQEFAVGDNIVATWDAGTDTHFVLRQIVIPTKAKTGWTNKMKIEFDDATSFTYDTTTAITKSVDDLSSDVYTTGNNGKKIRKVIAIVNNTDGVPTTADPGVFSMVADGTPIGSGAAI